MSNIIEELNKAREGKKSLRTKVEGDIITTWQIANRERVLYSEMSLYIIGGKCFIVLHKNKKYPNPEKVLAKEGDFVAQEVDSYTSNTIVQGIEAYRGNGLEGEYVNTYSYLSGWCLSREINLHKVLDI